MITSLRFQNVQYYVDLESPIDISLPMSPDSSSIKAWNVSPITATPVQEGNFIGDVAQGGSVNFMNITFNPHGNCTHTECIGHITKERFTINQCLKQFHFLAVLISVTPEPTNGGSHITASQLQGLLPEDSAIQALIIRTKPNNETKKAHNYSGTNPPYLDPDCAPLIHSRGIEHLLIDLPSVDPEEDGGRLAMHKAFWGLPSQLHKGSTITELIYVPDSIQDGLYLLNLQIASFEVDASPSKPVLYKIQ